MSDELCFTFDPGSGGGRGGGGGADDSRGRGRGGGGGRGGRGGRGGWGRGRGPRGAEGGWDGQDGQDGQSNLRRFASSDSLNRPERARRGRGRGGRGNHDYRDRGGRGEGRGSGRGFRGRDQSYDPSYRRNNFDEGDRGGGGGGRGRGEGRGHRGGRGRGNNQGPHREGRAGYFPIRNIAEIEDTDEITVRLNSQIDRFETFLSNDTLRPDDAMKTLQVLSRVILNDLHRETVHNILRVVCTSRFLDTHLLSVIQNLSAEFSDSKVVDTVDFIYQLLAKVNLTLPSYSSKGFLLLTLLTSNASVTAVLERARPPMVQGLKDLQQDCQRIMNSLREAPARREGAPRARRGPNEDDETPPDDFADLPIFPSAKDMDWRENIFLRANKEQGAFRDVNHYLDVQFRLLREDYIRPLRKGIREYRQLVEKGEVFRRSHDLRLYHKVQIISMVCKDSLEHRLLFDMTQQLKRVRWQSSKRLLFGSLVCLTNDDFDSIFFAVVTNRDVKDLEKGVVQIRMESGLEDILQLSSTDTFTMAETTAYFEAYRHVLEGLREMKDKLPMARYLVDCIPMIKPPQYLVSQSRLGRLNLTALLRHGSRHNASSVSVINPRAWPPLEETTLNESQLEAVQTALSKELAIIQGPPGTGKTYVGLKVAKILLENRDAWSDPDDSGSRPMLVVCYTNHALDQFLEGILAFCPEGIVRVGSRCKNEQLEEFNLKNLRRKMRTERKTNMSVRNSIRDCVRRLHEHRETIERVSSKLEATTKGIVSLDVLKAHMPPAHFESLVSRGLYSDLSQAGKGNVMMEWLSRGTITGSAEKGEEEGDPYPLLAEEMVSKVLQVEGGVQESGVDPREVHALPCKVRARLYRQWQERARAILQQDRTDAKHQGNTALQQDSEKWLTLSRKEILPDRILQRVISGPLFSTITRPMMQRHQQQEAFCIRAWLGIPEGAPPEVTSPILLGTETCDDLYFRGGDLMSLPRKTRVQLYRLWLQKLQTALRRSKSPSPETLHVLNISTREVLPDHLLKNAMLSSHVDAIRKDMLARHQRHSQFLVRAWLGVHEFCQNPFDLETLLDALDDDAEDEKTEEEGLNVDEEADVIQSARQLDVDDDDDLFNFGKKKSSLDVQQAMQELGVQTTTTAAAMTSGAGEDGFSVPRYHQKKQIKQLRKLLTSSQPMTQEEAEGVISLWSQQLTVEDRVRLYLFWLRRYQDWLRRSVKDVANDYNSGSEQLRELRMGEDKDIMKEATIIGMTTTGAARYRRVLAGVACPVIILEEAAEVLEAHVVTTLHQACQHLILIGDHQQLRPSPTVYELSKHYNLDLSLFERLVRNKLHHSTLAVQHRMRPEVARLVRHVYPALKDHDTTLGRPHIRGVKQDVFLFHHEVEETRDHETSSKSNQHEAELCVRLCRYLLQQGYPRDSITVLSVYSGQVFALKNIMKKDQDFYKGVRVTAVDNYQGEENDVILLSLVRSNQEGTVGFLGTDNRVCVALSRARDGFYAFGNFKILAESSELWKNICRTAKDQGQLGDSLLLRCQNHPHQETRITSAKDFDKMPEGGCNLPCGARLDCGHVCESSCHGYDRMHERYQCRKKCERVVCKLGHQCTKRCYEDCGQCRFQVEKTVPMCRHVATMECSKDPHTWVCKDPCKGTLPCGHQCSGSCGDCLKKRSHVSICKEQVERMWPCGHLVTSPCHVTPGERPCVKPCDATLACGHPCKGTCGECWGGRVHITCKQKCGLPLAGCGHRCRLPCGTTCLPCKKSCRTQCSHSSCKQLCGAACLRCMEDCPWKCKHQQCQSRCHQPCPPCPQPCGKKLRCGGPSDQQGSEAATPHTCSGFCGEKCFCIVCDRNKFVPLAIQGVLEAEESERVDDATGLVMLPQCGHIFNVVVLDTYVETKCKKLPAGSEVRCPDPTCNKAMLERDCWRYHGLFRERHARLQAEKQAVQISTTISQGRRQRLLDSLNMLTHNAENEKSFASKAARGHVFKGDVINVNTTFALTNQIKLTRVMETTAAALDQYNRLYADQRVLKDFQVLQKMLFKPASHMTTQRLTELSQATRTFAYMVKLMYAEQCCRSLELKERVQACLASLEKGEREEGSMEEVEAVLRECVYDCSSTWSVFTKSVDVSVLDASPEQDLCTVGKPSKKTPASTATASDSGQQAPGSPLTPSSPFSPSTGTLPAASEPGLTATGSTSSSRPTPTPRSAHAARAGVTTVTSPAPTSTPSDLSSTMSARERVHFLLSRGGAEASGARRRSITEEDQEESAREDREDPLSHMSAQDLLDRLSLS